MQFLTIIHFVMGLTKLPMCFNHYSNSSQAFSFLWTRYWVSSLSARNFWMEEQTYLECNLLRSSNHSKTKRWISWRIFLFRKSRILLCFKDMVFLLTIFLAFTSNVVRYVVYFLLIIKKKKHKTYWILNQGKEYLKAWINSIMTAKGIWNIIQIVNNVN